MNPSNISREAQVGGSHIKLKCLPRKRHPWCRPLTSWSHPQGQRDRGQPLLDQRERDCVPCCASWWSTCENVHSDRFGWCGRPPPSWTFACHCVPSTCACHCRRCSNPTVRLHCQRSHWWPWLLVVLVYTSRCTGTKGFDEWKWQSERMANGCWQQSLGWTRLVGLLWRIQRSMRVYVGIEATAFI